MCMTLNNDLLCDILKTAISFLFLFMEFITYFKCNSSFLNNKLKKLQVTVMKKITINKK